MKIPNDMNGNRTRDLTACSVMPQPTPPAYPPNVTADLLLQTLCNFTIIKILITNINGLQARNNLAKRERKTERERERERGAQYLQLAV